MPGMKILALETSTDFGTCALWQDGVIEQRICPSGRPHSETLLPLVRELMAGSEIGFTQLDASNFIGKIQTDALAPNATIELATVLHI